MHACQVILNQKQVYRHVSWGRFPSQLLSAVPATIQNFFWLPSMEPSLTLPTSLSVNCLQTKLNKLMSQLSGCIL